MRIVDGKKHIITKFYRENYVIKRKDQKDILRIFLLILFRNLEVWVKNLTFLASTRTISLYEKFDRVFAVKTNKQTLICKNQTIVRF